LAGCLANNGRSEGMVLVTNSLPEFMRLPALDVENGVHPGP